MKKIFFLISGQMHQLNDRVYRWIMGFVSCIPWNASALFALLPNKKFSFKNLTFFFLLFAIAFTACRKEEIKPVQETGSLTIGIGLHIHINEVSSGLKSTKNTDHFRVIIFNEDGTEAMSFDSVAAMPDTIELIPGSYYVEANSGNDLPAAFENPYYFGASDVFTISSNTQQSVLVICSLANTMVSVNYSDNIINNFTDYSTTIYAGTDSLVYLKDETRPGYFRPVPLDIKVDLSYLNPDGTESLKTLSGSIPEPLQNRHYEINVDASLDAGGAVFQILLDTAAIQTEIIEIKEDSAIQQEGAIAFGELLITEIMPNPSALSDTEGEWLEIFNNSNQSVNLQNLILQRNGIDSHTITKSIELSPAEFYVLARSATATGAINSYVYGSDILLPNTGAVLTIYNEGNGSDPGAMIFSVDYGAENFPSPTGASISLNPDLYNATDALSGTSWCTSTSLYNTGDAGTPGMTNDLCR